MREGDDFWDDPPTVASKTPPRRLGVPLPLVPADPTMARRAAWAEAGLTLGLGVAIPFAAGCIAGNVLPQLSRRSNEPEMLALTILILFCFVTFNLYCGLSELTKGGTHFERKHGLTRVRPDGTPMRASDWWRRHWPSLMLLAYIAFIWLSPALPYPYKSLARLHDRWLGRLWAWVGLAVLLVVVAGYVWRERRPTTVLVSDPRHRGPRGFEIVPADAVEAEQIEAEP